MLQRKLLSIARSWDQSWLDRWIALSYSQTVQTHIHWVQQKKQQKKNGKSSAEKNTPFTHAQWSFLFICSSLWMPSPGLTASNASKEGKKASFFISSHDFLFLSSILRSFDNRISSFLSCNKKQTRKKRIISCAQRATTTDIHSNDGVIFAQPKCIFSIVFFFLLFLLLTRAFICPTEQCSKRNGKYVSTSFSTTEKKITREDYTLDQSRWMCNATFRNESVNKNKLKMKWEKGRRVHDANWHIVMSFFRFVAISLCSLLWNNLLPQTI